MARRTQLHVQSARTVIRLALHVVGRDDLGLDPVRRRLGAHAIRRSCGGRGVPARRGACPGRDRSVRDAPRGRRRPPGSRLPPCGHRGRHVSRPRTPSRAKSSYTCASAPGSPAMRRAARPRSSAEVAEPPVLPAAVAPVSVPTSEMVARDPRSDEGDRSWPPRMEGERVRPRGDHHRALPNPIARHSSHPDVRRCRRCPSFSNSSNPAISSRTCLRRRRTASSTTPGTYCRR